MDTRVMLLTGAVAASSVPGAAQLDEAPFNERPAEAHVIIAESSRYNGDFSLSATARVCGELPAELNFSGVPAFIVQFYPDEGQGEINDITFGSTDLVGGVTSSAAFHLSVIVQSPEIGRPPAYVLDTSRDDSAGTAQLSFPEPGALILAIEGSNEMSETIRLTLHCKRRLRTD